MATFLLAKFRAHAVRAQHEAAVAKALLESGGALEVKVAAGACAGGDSARLRGVPIVSRQTGGAMRGTSPPSELLRKERERERG